jgi:hypothetical protein
MGHDGDEGDAAMPRPGIASLPETGPTTATQAVTSIRQVTVTERTPLWVHFSTIRSHIYVCLSRSVSASVPYAQHWLVRALHPGMRPDGCRMRVPPPCFHQPDGMKGRRYGQASRAGLTFSGAPAWTSGHGASRPTPTRWPSAWTSITPATTTTTTRPVRRPGRSPSLSGRPFIEARRWPRPGLGRCRPDRRSWPGGPSSRPGMGGAVRGRS